MFFLHEGGREGVVTFRLHYVTTFENQNLICKESNNCIGDLLIYFLLKKLFTIANDKKYTLLCCWTWFLVSDPGSKCSNTQRDSNTCTNLITIRCLILICVASMRAIQTSNFN